MKIYKKFTLVILSLLLSVTLFTGLFNYIIDPYGKNRLINAFFNQAKAIRDERISKFQLMKDHPKANSFLFGSSRGLMLDPILFGKLTDSQTLNLAFSSASADEYLLYIDYLAQNRKVEHIVIGIDLFAYASNFTSTGTLPQELRDYFNLDSGYPLTNYISFKMIKQSIKTIKFNLKGETYNLDKYTKKGQVIHEAYLKAKADQKMLEAFTWKEVIEKAARWDTRFNTLDIQQLQNLKKISAICRQNGIKLHLFMSPLHMKQIKMKQNKFFLQKELLTYIVNHVSDVWDYNGITTINTDPYAYTDEFHYSYDVGDSILQEMITGESWKEAYRGKLITQDNIESYIQEVNERLGMPAP